MGSHINTMSDRKDFLAICFLVNIVFHDDFSQNIKRVEGKGSDNKVTNDENSINACIWSMFTCIRQLNFVQGPF